MQSPFSDVRGGSADRPRRPHVQAAGNAIGGIASLQRWVRSWPRICSAFLLLTLIGCAASQPMPGAFVAQANGGSPGWIADQTGIPVFSPSANVVAWGSEDGIFLRSLNDSAGAWLTRRPVAGRIAWSPDGRRLAFIDRDAKGLVVLEVKSGETTLREPVANPKSSPPGALPTLGGPTWSPDGTKLAFACWDGRGDEVCVIHADGSQRRQITTIDPENRVSPGDVRRASSNAGSAAWSPSGTELAVAAYPEQRGAAAGVYVIDLIGNRARQISALQPSSELLWLADGRHVVFAATQKGRSDILKVSLGDDAPEILTKELAAGARDPALAVDETRLAVSSGGAILVLDAQNVVGALEVPGLVGRYPAWSRDGEAIAFVAHADSIANYD